MLLSTGEQISIALMAMAIQSARRAGDQLHRGPDRHRHRQHPHQGPHQEHLDAAHARRPSTQGKIVIVAGFQGIDENDNITTLGRGGSDTTAVALAAVMKHDPAVGRGEVGCEIYTDVDGIFTTDPRVVPEARKLDVVSYDEMLELA